MADMFLVLGGLGLENQDHNLRVNNPQNIFFLVDISKYLI